MDFGSISAVTSLYQAVQTIGQNNVRQQRGQEFKALADDLQSGDLSGAQKALSSLQQLLPDFTPATAGLTQSSDATTSSGTGSDISPITTNLTALGQALQSGDLSGAQNDFQKLMQALQSIGAGHHHHHHHKAAASVTGDAKSTGTNPIDTDLTALGQALQSTDLTAAQNSFTQLQQDMQTISQGHHHHHAAAGIQDAAVSASSNSGNNLEQLIKMWTAAAATTTSSLNVSA
jgi:hypothetical protein